MNPFNASAITYMKTYFAGVLPDVNDFLEAKPSTSETEVYRNLRSI